LAEYIVFFLHRKGEANRKIWEINQNEQNKKDALKNYDKVIELNKEYAYAYFGRGELYKSSGEKTLALSNFQRALFYFKKNPNEKRNVKLAEEKIKELK
jgi:tetratricopeptide (TPR) repeat protein